MTMTTDIAALADGLTKYAPRPGHPCPKCGSRDPHRHPAIMFDGEVEICTDSFHLTPTAQNRPEYIAAVYAKRAHLEARAEGREI